MTLHTLAGGVRTAMLRLLHFADAHIDIATTGRRDPETGLPIRALDFLRALDFIVETALREQVDLVLFAGDAFKDRHPTPTFQKAWAERILRLSRARIPVVLLVGNHDVSPAWGRAHVFELFRVFQTPNVHVIDRLQALGPDTLGLPLYLIGIPWIHRSALLAYGGLTPRDPGRWHEVVHHHVLAFFEEAMQQRPQGVPTVLVAHGTAPGALPGWERHASLDFDFRLPGSLLRDPRLDYVALGHIHRFQDLNPEQHPPAVYPGSIHRWSIDEAEEEKGFVLVTLHAPGKTSYTWVPIPNQRRFLKRSVRLEEPEGALEQALEALGDPQDLADAVVYFWVECTPEVDRALDWPRLYRHAREALEFRLMKRVLHPYRLRLPPEVDLARYTPLELLELYWKNQGRTEEEYRPLRQLARQVMEAVQAGSHHDRS